MRKLLVLGAGTAGTMVVNKMSHHLDGGEWEITIVDQDETHYYQPGFLFIPFGIYGRNDVIKAKRDYIPSGVKMITSPSGASAGARNTSDRPPSDFVRITSSARSASSSSVSASCGPSG